MFQAWSPFSEAVVHSRRIDEPISDAVNDARSYGAYGSGTARASKRLPPPPGRASLRKTIQASRASLQGIDRRAGPPGAGGQNGAPDRGGAPRRGQRKRRRGGRAPPPARSPRRAV